MRRLAFLLAGESSGDLHGSLLAREMLRADPDLEIWGVGGARMEAAGVRLLFRSDELAVVGLLEVVRILPRVLAALEEVRRFLAERRPDVFVPIDYPDFNFRLLSPAFRLGIPVAYYISPQLWAWRLSRVDSLRRYVRRMIVIFPFEETLYREHRVPVEWVGHPLIDRTPAPEQLEQEQRAIRAGLGLESQRPVVAVLPGSRRSEVERIGPVLSRVRHLMDTERSRQGLLPVAWVLGRAPELDPGVFSVLPGDWTEAPGFDALRAADLALVASGTATLEALLVGAPAVVVYRISPWTYRIARRLIRVDHIAMANLVAGREIVPEFIQDAAQPEAIFATAHRLLEDPGRRAAMRESLLAARERLGPPGAAVRAARAVLQVMGEAVPVSAAGGSIAPPGAAPPFEPRRP